MSEWQPIETAPRDGTLLILLLDRIVRVPSYQAEVEMRVVLGDLEPRTNTLFGPDGQKAHATHWMPLPEPPK